MKNKILFGTMLALLLVGSVSFADDDADKKRLLEEYDKMQEEKAKEQPQTVTEVVGENGEVEQVAVAPKKAEKDMTESERMDVEVQRIKKRMLEINDKIENYNKTNEMIDNLEKNVGELERKVNY
ncbi:FAD-I family protein [Fusobacterium nucleatum]|nr:FAD-I family protein [Fusobacterium nucleatum]